MSYNISYEDTVNTTAQWLEAVNNQVNGTPVIFSLILIWLAVFFISRGLNSDVSSSFVIASFVVTIISSLFFFIGFIGWQIIIAPIVMLIGGIIVLMFRKV